MKKLFLSTLISAVALSVPAFALDGSGTLDAPYYGTIQAGSAENQIFSTTENNTVYVGTADTALGGSGTNSYIAGTYTFLSNIVINAGGVYLTNGNSYNEATGANLLTFAGNISGTGNWTVTNTSGANVDHGYLFTGDLSSWSGNLSIVTNNSASHVYYGNGGTAATTTNVSGTGSINVYGTVTFNYAAGTVGIGNSSITALTLEFGGAADYNISSKLTGYNTSSKLAIYNVGYTTTFSGEVSGFSSIVSRSAISVASTGSFDISGSSVTLDSAIQNSGTVILDTSTTFVLDGLTATSGSLSSGSATYTLITGSSGTIQLGEDSLTDDNVSSLGTSNVSSSEYTITGATFTVDSGTLSVTVTTSGELLSGLHGTGSVSSPYYTSGSDSYKFSFDTSNFTGAGTTVYLASDTQSFGSTDVDFYWDTSVNAACDIVIGKAGIYLTDGSGGNIHTFSGAISGDGGLTVTNVNNSSSTGSTVKQHYAFTGDLSGWNGDITITTTNANDYLAFGGTLSTDEVGDVKNQVTGVTGVQAATNTSVSGNGAIAVDYGTVYYAYSAGANGQTGETLTVTNKSIEAHQIVFAGGVNYDVSADLKGWDGSGASDGDSSSNSTLTISTTGTVTVRGSVSDFDSIVVSSGSGLTVAAGASVTLKSDSTLTVAEGGTLTLNTSIAASAGTVEFASGASLVLTDAFLASAINTLDTNDAVTIIAASAITYNGSVLSDDNIDEFASIVSTSDNYLLSNWTYSDGVLSASVTYLPEPSMFGLMFGLGAIGLVATRRRRR